MKNVWILMAFALVCCLPAKGQTVAKKVYDETANPIEQIDKALINAEAQGKYVLCQVGGNWCPWCLRFADFVTKDEEISRVLKENYILLHTNYNPRKKQDAAQAKQAAKLMKLLGNPARFGFPVFVVLDADGKVVHIQDSSFLEEGNSYGRDKVLRFLQNWTPKAVKGGA